jgi:uncharacterized metal-binding protein YceD (DUF177 family)
MNQKTPLRRPGAEVGDRHEISTTFDLDPFDLYGRHHEIEKAEAQISVTKVSEGLHLDMDFAATLRTTCDRTLEPTLLELRFGDTDLLTSPNDSELAVEDWEMDVADCALRALLSEVPMQVFSPGSVPVKADSEEEEVDPRWRGLDGLFASGF